jgi:anaerobic magnesium-protoporphyrin IX monomethyl ester cyclase
LSFDDIVRIKQVEDVLEKYWNDHRMDHTIEYLVTHVFSSPFDFFQEFGSYWDQQGWSRIGHQLEDLFRRLYSFLKSQSIGDLETIEGLMKYDYLKNHKYKPRKPWWDNSIDKNQRVQVYKQIMEKPMLLGESYLEIQLDERELNKHTMLEQVSFDLNYYLMTGEVINKQTYLLVYFDPSTGQTNIYPYI